MKRKLFSNTFSKMCMSGLAVSGVQVYAAIFAVILKLEMFTWYKAGGTLLSVIGALSERFKQTLIYKINQKYGPTTAAEAKLKSYFPEAMGDE